MKYPYVVERILDHFPGLKPDRVLRRVRHGSFVNVEKRYLYFEVSKAACSQMKEILRRIEGGPPARFLPDWGVHSRRNMYIHARPNVPIPSLVDLDDQTQREVLESPDFLRMTVVRNPYKRLVSAWRNRVLPCEPGESEVYLRVKGGLPGIRNKSLVTFEEFVEYVENECDVRTCNSHWRLQVDHNFFPAMNYSLVAKVEQLGEGLARLQKHLGLEEPLAARGKNVSAPVGSAAYTQELADRVYALYRQDFEILGYDRNSWAAGKAQSGGKKTGVPEEIFFDEIIERNLVILKLFEERQRLLVHYERASKLHLIPVMNGIAACHEASQKLAGKLRSWGRRMLHPDGDARPSRAAAVLKVPEDASN